MSDNRVVSVAFPLPLGETPTEDVFERAEDALERTAAKAQRQLVGPIRWHHAGTPEEVKALRLPFLPPTENLSVLVGEADTEPHK